MIPSAWHQEQDRAIDRSLDVAKEMANHAFAARRLWHHASSWYIHNAHMLNLMIVFKRDESFRVLDVGCGVGELTRRVAMFFPNSEVVGIDCNSKSLSQARSVPAPKNVRFEEVDLTCQIEGATLGRFDAVICSEVYEHVEDTQGLLRFIDQALMEGGRLSFSTPSGWMHRFPNRNTLRWIRQSPVTWWRLGIRPEHHWRDALPTHPAIQPRKFIRHMESRGYTLLNRLSCAFYIRENSRSLVYRATRALERRRPVGAPSRLYYIFMLLEALMNLCPLMRVLESRFVVLLERTRT